MSATVSTDFLLRVAQATPKQQTAMERILREGGATAAAKSELGAAVRAQNEELAAVIRKAVADGLRAGAFSAPEPLNQGEAQRIFAVLTKLRTETGVRKAPLHTVFEYMVLQGLSGEETARRCKCAPSLISARVKTLKERFGMSVGRLHNYASALSEMETAVKGDRRRGKKAGQPDDFERPETGGDDADESDHERERFRNGKENDGP